MPLEAPTTRTTLSRNETGIQTIYTAAQTTPKPNVLPSKLYHTEQIPYTGNDKKTKRTSKAGLTRQQRIRRILRIATACRYYVLELRADAP